MTFFEHINGRMDVYIILVVWALFGAFLPTLVAAGLVTVSFLFVLRTKDLTRIFIAFIALLILSDSRASMFAFAATAKIPAVVLLSLYVLLNYSDMRQGQNRIFMRFLPFFLFALLASSWAISPFTAFQKSLSYGLIFFIVPIFFNNASRLNQWFPLELIYFFFVVLAVGLVLNVVFPSFASLVGRYRGLLGNPNGLGIFLTVLFAFYYTVSKKFEKTIKKQHFQYFFLGALFTSLVLSGSRTSLIALVLFFSFNRLSYLSNALTLLLFVSFIASYEYLVSQLPSIILFLGLEDFFRLETLDDGSGRFIAWTFAWAKIQDVFFIGGGFSYTEYIFKFFGDELSRLGHQGNAHNSYLTIWLDTGFIGILLFGYGLIRTIIDAAAKSKYTLPIVYSVLFSSYFESWLSASLNPFTSLFLLSLTMLTESDLSVSPESDPDLLPNPQLT